MEEALCFVQFLHPGKEHIPDKGNEKRWNTESVHKRKFVRNRGQFLNSVDGSVRDVKTEVLNFWCEWEPDSCVEKLQFSNEREPHFIHTLYFVKPSTYNGHRNTDPFVFGENFLYSNCHQYTDKNTRPTQLRDLKDGSIILFGSRINKGYRLDTVFVVKHSVCYNAKNFKQVLERSIKDRANRDMFSEAVIQPLFKELGVGSCNASQGKEYRLYFGATVHDPVYCGGGMLKPMFSFFPARVDDNSKRGFERLQIKMDVISDTMNQFFKPNRNASDIYGKWREVAECVLSHDLVLGVKADLPLRKSVRS